MELTQTLELGAFLLYDMESGVLFTLARAVKNSVCLIFPSTEWVFKSETHIGESRTSTQLRWRFLCQQLLTPSC